MKTMSGTPYTIRPSDLSRRGCGILVVKLEESSVGACVIADAEQGRETLPAKPNSSTWSRMSSKFRRKEDIGAMTRS
jgi:hypothetical protein